MKRRIELLETTLRDGSYTIDFRFTAEDTRRIAAKLEKAGFDLIELGHGIGLNATKTVQPAAATDEEYLQAAHESLKRATWCMFCIPGFATIDHVELAAKRGMPFIRIGTNITEYEKAEPFVKRAKELGMRVSLNLMKSYVVSLSEFIRIAKIVEGYGSDVVVLVDSAGNMLPEDVAQYIRAMRKELRCKIGFHGHDNLGLANGNTLVAVEEGADIIDTSLRGIGRSSGNAQTETMLLLLKRRGYDLNIDVKQAMAIGEEEIAPLVREARGASPVDAICGYAGFHSSYLPIVEKAAKERGVDLLDLILEVCTINRVRVTNAVVAEAIERIKGRA